MPIWHQSPKLTPRYFLYIKILVSEQRNTVCEKTVELSQFVDYEERQKGLS